MATAGATCTRRTETACPGRADAAGSAGRGADDSDPPQASQVVAATRSKHRFTIRLSADREQCINDDMPLDPKILEGHCLPQVQGPLGDQVRRQRPSLCRNCRLAYPVVDDIPNLITDDAKPLEKLAGIHRRKFAVGGRGS